MERINRKKTSLIHILAFNAFAIAKAQFIIVLWSSSLLKMILFEDETPNFLFILFTFSLGIFLGAAAIFYSLKHLRSKELKDLLPLN